VTTWCLESVAILCDLDRKYPRAPLFGGSAEEGGVILRVIEEFQSHTAAHFAAVVDAIGAARLKRPHAEVLEPLLAVAGEARTIEGRLAQSESVVGLAPSVADFVI
jgi:glutathione S-transferase